MDRRRNETLDHHYHLHPQTHIPGKDSNSDPYPSPLPIATISSPSNSKTPPLLPPPPPAVRYSECLKNHALSTGGHVIDGCGEFMPAGEEGSPEALKCAACDCHRNFHRREYEGESQIKSAANSFYPYNPNRNSTILRTTTTTHLTQVPPPLPPPPPHHNNHRYSQGLSASAFMMAFGGASGAPAESSSEDLNMFHSYNVGTQQLMTQPPFSPQKRFRTKFTQEQKDRMEEIAERLGWKIQKQDEEEVEKFCGEVAVKKQAFKVWIHNNKQSMKKKQLVMEQKQILLSALSVVGVGVGVGLGLATGQTVTKWTSCYNSSAADGVTAEQIEQELLRLVINGKESKVTFDDFPYYLSERTQELLTSAAYVHLNHLDVSKYTRNFSPASRAILLSGPVELYQQMLAKALAHHFEAKLLLLDVTDFSLKMQCKYGTAKKDPSFKRSISEVALGRMSSLFGSISILPSREDGRGTLSRHSSSLDIKSRGMEGANDPPKHRRNASTSTDTSSISSQCSSSNTAPLKRISSWSFDEKLFLQSLFKGPNKKILCQLSMVERRMTQCKDLSSVC